MISQRLSTRLKRNLHLKSHLDELSGLIGRQVAVSDLEEVELTQTVRQKSMSLSTYPKKCFEILFREKSERRFGAYLGNLSSANPAPIYLWTRYSDECGLLRISTLADIDLSFPFDASDAGILSLVTEDFMDQLSLDYFEEGGELLLEVSTQGRSWPTVSY